MSSILSFDIISFVDPDPKIFLCIPASPANAAAVNPNGIKTFLANGLITFFIKGSPVIMDQEVYHAILLIVSSWITEFLKLKIS